MSAESAPAKASGPAPRPDVIEPERKALVRGAAVDLAARDPEFIRRQLPLMWLLSTFYFRAEVRGLQRIPQDGPVLFVGNHSGGNVSPDSMVFMLAFNTYFGMERPIYALAHSLVTTFPLVGRVGKKWGIVTAGPQAGEAILAAGADVLVYPGGDQETHRAWTRNEEVRFGGRRGFLRLALHAGVPIVPVVSLGGQDTFLPLTSGRRVARALRLDRLARLKVLPISLAVPWGLNVGDMLGHLPLPAKIRIEVLPPIDVVKRFGRRGADSEEAYEYVTSRMQEALTTMAAERVVPGL
ncbi:MAG: acyltransferase family protein [Actinomycetota bacterium]|nr:acyltransferase family protein [Actinomycetota bacterium]